MVSLRNGMLECLLVLRLPSPFLSSCLHFIHLYYSMLTLIFFYFFLFLKLTGLFFLFCLLCVCQSFTCISFHPPFLVSSFVLVLVYLLYPLFVFDLLKFCDWFFRPSLLPFMFCHLFCNKMASWSVVDSKGLNFRSDIITVSLPLPTFIDPTGIDGISSTLFQVRKLTHYMLIILNPILSDWLF